MTRTQKVQRTLGIIGSTSTLILILGGVQCNGQGIREINPSHSNLSATEPDGASGGRVNHVGVASGDNKIIFAASEWGGIYRSTDAGQTWVRMDGHHPTVTWDVKVSSAEPSRVIATSFYDGRVNSIAGINVSSDGGVSWLHPATATPPAGFCSSEIRRGEPSAFGISFDPEKPQNVYVGTNCGLAISHDGGNTWHYVNPASSGRADDVWAVAVHHNGIVDTCGDDGHRRSTTGGTSWTSTSGNGTPLVSGMCSIAASPDESYVLFATVGTTIFESDDGGGSWTSGAYANPEDVPQGRITFVKTNRRGVNQYDLWFGDVSLYRRSCTTPSPPNPGGNNRCQPSSGWTGGFTRSNGSHDDLGDIAFEPNPSAVPACPLLMSSDGGVFLNTLSSLPECQTPAWTQPQVTPRGLWAFGMNGSHAASGTGESLYLANQDNGTFASVNAEAPSLTWYNLDCCDSFDIAADTNQVLYSSAWWPSGRGIRLFLRGVGMTGGGEINRYPSGDLLGWIAPDAVDRFGKNKYLLLTDKGVFITMDITANPISWNQLGTASNPVNGCAAQAVVSGSTPSFFVEAGSCTGSQPDQVWRYDGTSTGTAWHKINSPAGFTGFGVFAVDKKNPDRLFAAVLNPPAVQMVFSTDGGTNWLNLVSLDNAMRGGGTYKYLNISGPTDFTGFKGYAQPTLVAFSPFDTKTLVAASADSGIFLSHDTGNTWTTITDNSGTTANPHVPRAKFSSFDRGGGSFAIFIGTQGRGVWRINYPDTKGACQSDCRSSNQ
jgi:hypothetical protein